MAHQPILPTSIADPVGSDRIERACIAEFSRRLRQVRQLYEAAIPEPVRIGNAEGDYYYLSPELLQSTLEGLGAQVTRILLENGQGNLWFIEAGIVPAYEKGTGAQYANLSVQSSTYKVARGNLTTLLSSPEYQRRLAFLRGRLAFELDGYSNKVKAHMSRVLQDGLATGKNPRVVAKELQTQIGIDYRDAEFISRTEIPGALRAARMQEADQAAADLGIRTLELHLSACSPTTRPTHYARMGTLHTTGEQRAWWERDGNRFRCKCSTVTTLVDAQDKPLTPGVVTKALAIKAANPLPERPGRNPKA